MMVTSSWARTSASVSDLIMDYSIDGCGLTLA